MTARSPAPSTVLAGLVVAFCAVLMAKWLAIAALGALALYLVVHRLVVRGRGGPLLPAAFLAEDRGLLGPGADDCSWCGLAGGHRDPLGRPLRPRLAHVSALDLVQRRAS